MQPENVVTQFTSIVFQNASKCTISKEKIPKCFWGGGTAPSPDPIPIGEGDTLSPDPRPRLHSSNPLQTTFLATGLDQRQLSCTLLLRLASTIAMQSMQGR